MSFTTFATVSRPAIRSTECPYPYSERVMRLNRKVAMIKLSIPTKEELERADAHETRQSMVRPDTAIDTDSEDEECCMLRRL